MHVTPVVLFLGQAAILVYVPYLIWRLPLVGRLLPLVVVQILVGIALGPSLLGKIVPASVALLDAEGLAALSGLAWIAVVMYAFLTGLHFDAAETRGRGKWFLSIALASVAVPAALGLLAGYVMMDLSPKIAVSAADPLLFACAVAVALAVTALPVLGAVLRETDLIGQRIGRDALGFAAINDLLLWVLLAGLLAVAKAQAIDHVLLLRLGLGALYLAAMFWVVRPLAGRALHRLTTTGECRQGDLVIVVSLALASACVTEAIGLHFILGSFVAGAIVPPACARPLLAHLEPVTVVVLLPFFFILTGLRTEILLTGDGFLMVFLVTTAAALAGKMIGSTIPARIAGETWNYSVRLGILMQCKGLMDVVVLSVLFDAGILSKMAFSAMVLMAVVTTAATKPMLLLWDVVRRRRRIETAQPRH
jgi:Kef-type K+ transport system membrane component KefB